MVGLGGFQRLYLVLKIRKKESCKNLTTKQKINKQMQLSPDLLCLQRCAANQSPPDRLERWRPQY